MTSNTNTLVASEYKPKMLELTKLFSNPFPEFIPVYKVIATDDLGSPHIFIDGTFNSSKKGVLPPNFCFVVRLPERMGSYRSGDKVEIKLLDGRCRNPKIVKSFRRYIGTPEKCAERMRNWLKLCADNPPTWLCSATENTL